MICLFRRFFCHSLERKVLLLSSLFMCALFSTTTSFAALTEEEFEQTSQYCSRYFDFHEKKYSIPNHLVKAISTQESGRQHKANSKATPWPWTINVSGKGYFFPTKRSAVRAVQSLQARGVAMIDVGCMQINLRYHPDAFSNLDQAFEPKYNIDYGARFLRGLYDRHGSWQKAVAQYHSASDVRGRSYASKVFDRWRKGGSSRIVAWNDAPLLRSSGITSSPEAPLVPIEDVTFSALARFGRVRN